MTEYTLDAEQLAAQTWFQSLRDQLCAAFETLEDEGDGDAPAGRFERTAWDRPDSTGAPGGGGVMSVMKGRVFEKVGVNTSTVFGEFAPEFAKSINGADADPRFFATGISLVAHMANPHVPAVHMNTRFLVTTKRWFGGGADLNPALPVAADTADFKTAFKAACDRHGSDYYSRFDRWCDEYFFVPHRNRHRGVGGIFYDHLEGAFAANFAFTQDVGRTLLGVYPEIVRRHMHDPFTDAERIVQLRYRGLYAEFNLVYDRGTTFGLKTGGNVEAILMSLPPLARWD
ncbi:oxygen-dependent coproporphyrinogen oxidase [Polymorphobacter megasporae]|uniref:oxygen-dependent coproporphyrinogen oxidase n=1 Tax=Glacieibacterium megasporae TaxID=2835787 RepID=UPI001C1E7CF9|nr:oxygen-dependent coproporphyrinogen oxidase [Polymorphobacter megasporae]UAJ11646.1 oxygen-dependent coproporphyrinogen oxidase [Polymorphobacter megasporae]